MVSKSLETDVNLLQYLILSLSFHLYYIQAMMAPNVNVSLELQLERSKIHPNHSAIGQYELRLSVMLLMVL